MRDYKRTQLRATLFTIGLLLLVAGLGCNLSGLLLEQLEPEQERVETEPTPTPRSTDTPIAPSTSTPAPPEQSPATATPVPPVPPLSDEGGAANALEARIRKVADAVSSASDLSGFVWTQLTDVQQEVNGLLGFDRVPKLPLERLHAILTAVGRR